jgi:sugar lactone lactonase YvrE
MRCAAICFIVSVAACGGSGDDDDGPPPAPIVLAEGQSQPWGLTTDATHVYWGTFGGTVARVAKTGGAVEVLVTGEELRRGAAVDATNVYWLAQDGRVRSAPRDGGAAVTAVDPLDPATPAGLLLDGNTIYWTTMSGLHRATLPGGTAERLSSGDGGFHLALAGTEVLWITSNEVRATAGMTTRSIATANRIEGVAVCGTTVYFNDNMDGTVHSAPLAGGGTSTTIATAQVSPFGIACDDDRVYWTSSYGGAVVELRLLIPGAAPEVISQGLAFPTDIVADDDGIFWLDGTGGTPGRVMARLRH